MKIKSKNKYLFIGIVVFLILPLLTYSQALDLLGEDTLLKEYLFPISAYLKSGQPITLNASECEGFKEYGTADFYSCQDLPAFGTADEKITKWVDEKDVITESKAEFFYKFDVTEQGDYVFKINASNNADNFKNLTREQIDYILDDMSNVLAQDSIELISANSSPADTAQDSVADVAGIDAGDPINATVLDDNQYSVGKDLRMELANWPTSSIPSDANITGVTLNVIYGSQGGDTSNCLQYNGNDTSICPVNTGGFWSGLDSFDLFSAGITNSTDIDNLIIGYTNNSPDDFSMNFDLVSISVDYQVISTGTALDVNGLLDLIGEDIDQEVQMTDSLKYDLVRSLIFSVYVDGEAPENRKGFIFADATDPSKVNTSEVEIDNLLPGQHTIFLHSLNNKEFYNFAYKDIPDYYQSFQNADLDLNGILEYKPIIYSAAIDRIVPGDDVIGIRIYSNKYNKDINTWYQETVINPSEAVEQLEIDNYEAIKDDRTIYVNAPNIIFKDVCYGGEKDGELCTSDSDCADSGGIIDGDCKRVKFFYTNIYVIAYNQSATATTMNIFAQMLDKWRFNVNIIEEDPFEAAAIKEKLRRDAKRLADLGKIEKLLQQYKANNGNYPILDAGTFVANHAISTWPSWQSTLGNELGSALPTDPINIMSAQIRGTYKCNDLFDRVSFYCSGGEREGQLCTEDDDCPSGTCEQFSNCENICSRDSQGNPLTGCPANKQCVNDDYCSICPLPYDVETCWEELESKFAYGVHEGCNVCVGGDNDGIKGCLSNDDCPGGVCDDSLKLNGAFNLGGDNCQYNGAYVYQYTSLDEGQSYLLNYRLEYTEEDVCSPGQCVFGNKCYQPGECLAGCKGGTCRLPDYKNIYCYLGTWKRSCGDGFLQAQCGEICDPGRRYEADQSWCDITYGSHDWYNESNINVSCTNVCQWSQFEGIGYTPQAYTRQTDDIDCGGYCGDDEFQRRFEQCDEGVDPAPIPRLFEGVDPYKNAGGISESSQYMCAGVKGGAPLVKQATECDNYSEDWDELAVNSCADLPLGLAEPRLSVMNVDDIVGEGGLRLSYTFNLSRSSPYTFKIRAANYGDKIINLSDQQIDYLMTLQNICLGGANDSLPCNDDGQCPDGVCEALQNPDDRPYLYNLLPDRSLDIPEYPQVVTDATKYHLVRSLIFAVYLDGDNETNRKGFITVNADVSANEGTLSLGQLSAGNHTIYLHFVGDHFYLLFAHLTDLPAYLNNFLNVDYDTNQALDINPIIYEVSLYSPELGVGNCQSFAGWCGDGIVQLEYGEQCDKKDYIKPLPAETSNIIKNPSFEGSFSPWRTDSGSPLLDQANYFVGQASAKFVINGVISIEQSINIFEGKPYTITLRAKPFIGSLDSICLQVGSDQPCFNEVTDDNGWKLYRIENYSFSQNSNQISIFFTPIDNATFYLDDIKFTPLDTSVKPQYECGETEDDKICQFVGGYCGDGIIQTEHRETCDDRVGFACTSDADCGIAGYCESNICASKNCSNICQGTSCGDGIIQRPNAYGLMEICDPGQDPLCSGDCQHIKMGGRCTHDSSSIITCDPSDLLIDPQTCLICSDGLSCTIRNFGDADLKCLGARGSYGCTKNDDCILGYYCNISSRTCESEISTYLKYHSQDKTKEPLYALPFGMPISYCDPDDDACITYDINITTCPDLETIITPGKEYLLDHCTGLFWEANDNISQSRWTYQEAVANGCSGATRLPSIGELYSLVRQTNTGLLYSDREALRLCPAKCSYDEKESDLCSDCADDNYIYWSNTCSKGSSSQDCQEALAVNFKYGSIEKYPLIDKTETPDFNEQSQFKVHCIKDTVCGNGIIEEDETCEFYLNPVGGGLAEQDINAKCTDYGYDGGFVHCDRLSCNYRLENCYLNSEHNKTCEEICQGRQNLPCESIGLDIEKPDDFYDIDLQIFDYANDGLVKDREDISSECFNLEGGDCQTRFQDKGAYCYSDGVQSPFVPQYSYCNCEEKQAPPPIIDCGNGVVDFGEQCDDGNLNNEDICNNACQWTVGALLPIYFDNRDNLADSYTANGIVFAADNDFDTLSAIDVADGINLKVSTVMQTPYIWIANSDVNLISKIRTYSGFKITVAGPTMDWEQKGAILGVYPLNGVNPSRTAVNVETGDVWVANRDSGNITKLDIDGNIMKVCTTGSGPRGVAIQENGDVWVSNFLDGTAVKISGDNTNCAILASVKVGYNATLGGPYGLAIDSNNNVWVSNRGMGKIQKIDTSTYSVTDYPVPFFGITCAAGYAPYGIAVDFNDDIWVADTCTGVYKLDQSEGTVAHYAFTGLAHVWGQSRGLTVDTNGSIWIAFDWSNQVIKIINPSLPANQAGNYGIYNSTGVFPVGIVGDSSGQVWAVNQGAPGTSTVYNINNPTVGIATYPVRSTTTVLPYTYSDMTGLNRALILRTGVWQGIFDSGYENKHWGAVSWQEIIPSDKQSVEVYLRASNDETFTNIDWIDSAEWNDFSISERPAGQYLQIKVIARSRERGVTPVVYDLKVQ